MKNLNSNNDNKSCASTSINWYPGHMAKTKKELIEIIKLVDVVVEIIDARIPNASRNPDIDNLAKDKKRIVVLNKSDLANEKQTEAWKSKLKGNGISVCICDSNNGKGIEQVLKEAEKLMADVFEKQEQKGRIGRPIRIAVLGIPNVGKSSFINRIAKRNTADVGNKPGVTKQNRWIRINSKIELLDTPGVLWPKFESEEVGLNLAFTGSINDEILDKEEIAYYLLKKLSKNYFDNVINRYNIVPDELDILQNNSDETYELMQLIGKKRGAIISGGKIDENKTANIILKDFREARIGKITLEVI